MTPAGQNRQPPGAARRHGGGRGANPQLRIIPGAGGTATQHDQEFVASTTTVRPPCRVSMIDLRVLPSGGAPYWAGAPAVPRSGAA